MSEYCPMCDASVELPPGDNGCPDCGTILRSGSKGGAGVPSSTPDNDSARGESKQDRQSEQDDRDPESAGKSQCPNCGESVEPEFAACPYCTEPLDAQDSGEELVCRECGYDDLKPAMTVCPMCQNPVRDARDEDVEDTDGETDDEVDSKHPVEGGSEDSEPPKSSPSTVELRFDSGPTMKLKKGTSVGEEIRRKLYDAGFELRDARRVSRSHIMVKQDGNDFYVVDLESTNGTWLNGTQLDPNEKYEIADGDTLTFADIEEATVRLR